VVTAREYSSDSRLAVVEMWWWDPFGDAVSAGAGGPALFGEFVVGAAGQGEVVDVGDVGFGPSGDVVDLGEVAGHVAAWGCAAAVFGVEDEALGR
jgi:hypothetical protein